MEQPNRQLRLRHADLDAAIDRLFTDTGGGTARRLVQIYNAGQIPTQPDRFYAAYPVELDGTETEGSQATATADSSQTLFVDVLGQPAQVGDQLVALAVGGRWVAERGPGGATSGPPAGPKLCTCQSIPPILSATDSLLDITWTLNGGGQSNQEGSWTGSQVYDYPGGGFGIGVCNQNCLQTPVTISLTVAVQNGQCTATYSWHAQPLGAQHSACPGDIYSYNAVSVGFGVTDVQCSPLQLVWNMAAFDPCVNCDQILGECTICCLNYPYLLFRGGQAHTLTVTP